jgi:hypothetical protein
MTNRLARSHQSYYVFHLNEQRDEELGLSIIVARSGQFA